MAEEERKELIEKMARYIACASSSEDDPEADWCYDNWPAYETEARAALAAAESLFGKGGRMVEDLTWFWAIVDKEGFANVPSSEIDALRIISQKASESDALREENARLREALKAFVPETQWIDPAIPDTRPIDVMVRAGELRAAAAAIPGKIKDEAACPAPDEAP